MTAAMKSGGNQSTGVVLKTIGVVSTACGVVSAFMILASVLITCQMIWMRFVMNESTIWQTESVVYLMIGATLIGLPYVQKLRGHVNVDLMPLLLPPGPRKVLAAFTLVVTMAIVAVMCFFGYELWYFAFDRGWKSDTVWGVSLWIPYLSIPVGFGLFFLQLGADLVELVTDKHIDEHIDDHTSDSNDPGEAH